MSKEQSPQPKMNPFQVLQYIRDKNVKYVRFEVSDIYGVARSKTITSRHFNKFATEGLNLYLGIFGFDPQAYVVEGSGFHKEINFSDGLFFPEYDSFTMIPWFPGMARVLANPTLEGKSIEVAPRNIALKQLARLQELGMSLYSAHEMEFYLVQKDTKEPITQGKNIYSTIRNNAETDFLHQIVDELPGVGVIPECFACEYGPGQLEITYSPAFGIQAADNAHTFKTSVKELAQQKGYIASFMSKPYPQWNGSSSHFNHSLWDAAGKKNLMYDVNEPYKLSKTAQYWIAGILSHIPAITVMMAPTVNCLKRFGKFEFTPTKATWGIENRSCALRVKNNGEKGTYVENRLGAAGCNPYLSLAATVAAGIDGIIKQLPLPPQVTGDATGPMVPPSAARIPDNMEDALKAFAKDKVICEALGEEFCKCFGAMKLHELKLEKESESKGTADSWEHDLFFEYL